MYRNEGEFVRGQKTKLVIALVLLAIAACHNWMAGKPLL